MSKLEEAYALARERDLNIARVKFCLEHEVCPNCAQVENLEYTYRGYTDVVIYYNCSSCGVCYNESGRVVREPSE